MKIKTLVLALAVVAGTFVASAQEKECCGGKNIYIGLNGGVISVMNDGFNAPNFYGSIELGRWIKPFIGVRGTVGGLQQTLDPHKGQSKFSGDDAYSVTKKFGEANLDVMFNLSQVFAPNEKGYNVFEVVLFAGAQGNVATRGSYFTGKTFDSGEYEVKEDDKVIARAGASAGAAINFNLNKNWAIGFEGRMGVMPSIFGDADAYRKAEATGRLTFGVKYTFKGRHGKCKPAPVVVPQVVEKVVEKEVVKEVPVEVVKEVVKEIPASSAVFFPIGKATLTSADKARIQLYAEAIKASNAKFVVTGYCDKATGSAKYNQKLSEKRADVVYDALVKFGVNPDQLVKAAEGGVDPIFFNDNKLSRTVIMKVE